MIKATCPKNPKHKTFVTAAHVMEEWQVDENGNFMKVLSSLQTTHGPCVGNTWTCYDCDEVALVEDSITD